jgi:replicative DNA helicase
MLSAKEIEARIVGACMRNPDGVHAIRDRIQPEAFADPLMRELYRVIDDLAVEGVSIDRAIISRRAHVPADITLPVFLAKLQAEAAGELTDYVNEFADAHLRRQALALFESGRTAMETKPRALEALQEMQASLIQIIGSGQTQGATLAALTDAILLKQKKGKDRRIATGLYFVDAVTGPMGPGNLIVLGGSTSAGKSALAGQIAYSVSQRALKPDPENPQQMLGCPVLYISLEMEPEEIMGRFLSHETGFPLWRIEQGELNISEERSLDATRDLVAQYPLYIETMARATVSGVLAVVMKYQKLHGVGLVVIDHLHYLKGANRKSDRFAQIEEVVIDLKAAAKQTKIPWIAISHLSRDIGKREDKRPMLSDLYGASEIEKSADVVFFVHRESYWLERLKPRETDYAAYEKWEHAMRDVQGKAEIIVLKRRAGKAPATKWCRFNEELTRFEDINGGR